MTTITITVEDELEAVLKEFAEETGLSPDEAVKDALRRQLRLFRVKKLQKRLSGRAEAAGYTSEDELLDDLS